MFLGAVRVMLQGMAKVSMPCVNQNGEPSVPHCHTDYSTKAGTSGETDIISSVDRPVDGRTKKFCHFSLHFGFLFSAHTL